MKCESSALGTKDVTLKVLPAKYCMQHSVGVSVAVSIGIANGVGVTKGYGCCRQGNCRAHIQVLERYSWDRG